MENTNRQKLKEYLLTTGYFVDWDELPISAIVNDLSDYPHNAIMSVDDYRYDIFVYRYETDKEMEVRLQNETRQKEAVNVREHAEYLRLKAKYEGV